MKNINYFLVLATCCMALTSCHYTSHSRSNYNNHKEVKASGETIKNSLVVSDFDEIQASSVVNVIITNSDVNIVSTEIDQAYLEHIEVFVSDNKLNIKSKNSFFSTDGKGALNVYVSGKNVRKVKMSGISSLRVQDGIWVVPDIEISVSGISKLNGGIDTEKMSLNLSGSSRINLDGNIKDLTVKAAGASKLTGALECEKVSFDVAGASSVVLSGRTQHFILDVSGASNINAFELDSEMVDCRVSGASRATINATKDIKISASGASSVSYKGDGLISHISLSGASSINKR